MTTLSRIRWALLRVPLEGYLLVAVIGAGVFWTTAQPKRSFWGEVACDGYLFPQGAYDDAKVRRGLRTPAEQREAFAAAAHRVGYDGKTADAVGKSAAILCNRDNAK